MAIFEKIYSKVIGDLVRGLPYWLSYHDVNHTKYVLQKAEEIAKEENISGRELLLVKIAALYHDTGFLEDRKDHEERSCKIFSVDFSESDLSLAEIELVCGLIMATRVPQQAETLLAKIVADADLEYLGTEHFESFSKHLYQEIFHFEPELTTRKWDELQIKFLTAHKYHTAYCKIHNEPVKQKNLELVKKRLMTYKK